MTGYGRVEVPVEEKTLIVEVKSLNSKLPDIRIKTSMHLGQRELDLRRLILDSAVRGKIDVAIDVRHSGGGEMTPPNFDLIRSYYKGLKGLAEEIGVDDSNLYSTVLKLPNIFMSENGELDDELWQKMRQATEDALNLLRGFRQKEGNSLFEDLSERTRNISRLLADIEPLETERSEALRSRLRQKIQEIESESVDQNRFEQELIYYMDKLDIHEEKVRLEQHCQYFLEVLGTDASIKGKKLNFISQEIGREINTLGSKAQWSSIQHLVVQMKNELEKIKEQLANVL